MSAEKPQHITSRPADAASLPDVSIVIASWNGRPHLLNCLRAIEALDDAVSRQTIVVDNASSDGSPEAVQASFPGVVLLRNENNLGFAHACNRGIERASGRYVCLMNSDAVARPGALDALVRFMDARPRVGLVGPRVLNSDGSLQPSCRRFPAFTNQLSDAFALWRLFPRSSWWAAETMTYWDHDTERRVEVLCGCCLLARREALSAVGLLDETFFFYSSDIDWSIRFHAAGWEVRFCPDAEVFHIGGASSSAAPQRFAVEKQRARLQLYRKHYSRPAVAGLMVLAFIHELNRAAARLVLYAFRPARRRQAAAQLETHAACLRWMLLG